MPAPVQMPGPAGRSAGTGSLPPPALSAATQPPRRTLPRPAKARSEAGGSQEGLLAADPLPPFPHYPPNQGKRPAKRDQHTAEPDQGHEGLPPQAELPAALLIPLAQHGVELAVPA